MTFLKDIMARADSLDQYPTRKSQWVPRAKWLPNETKIGRHGKVSFLAGGTAKECCTANCWISVSL